MTDFLWLIYPWSKTIHILAVISWMAGLFYLPRLYVYHVERVSEVPAAEPIFFTMEEKLMKVIMRPAMITAWIFGLIMVATPGLIDWSLIWPWTKGASVLGMTWFHGWLEQRRRAFLATDNALTGRQYRMMNEVPTVLMVVIVASVIFKF
ncbi:MAG TPA: hypothetical protein DEA05_00105 [Rhodobacteraceae bacterium]|nr:hypothetical protein [Paracoccaceae bacterium]